MAFKTLEGMQSLAVGAQVMFQKRTVGLSGPPKS